MLTFLGGLVLVCCTAAPPPPPPPLPPPPQGTNKGLLSEPLILTSIVDTIVSRKKNDDTVTSGPYLRFGAGVPGAGWIAVGPGYRHLFGDRLLFDASGTVSWRQYLSGRARLELRPLANADLRLGAMVQGQDWTQAQFFGVGPESRQDDRSIYRLRASDVSAYATISPGHVFELRARAGILNRPRITRASGWHKGPYPDVQSLFTDSTAPGLTEQPKFWHADVAVSADTLDHPDHPTRGFLIELAASQFDDRDLDRYSHRRYELSTVAMVPVVGNLWTIGARVTAMATETSGANQVPFYMLPSLGQTLLRGFDTDRFHDRNLIAIDVESRWAIFQHLDAALFADFGQVAPRFSALNRKDFESSVGVGLRLHTGATTFFRVDAARTGLGGWRVAVKMHDSLSVSRDQRWNNVVPVVR